MAKAKILVVDDENTLRFFLKRELEEDGYAVTEADNGDTALALLRDDSFDVAILDLRLPGVDGQQLMRHIKTHTPNTGILIITAYATLDSAIDAVKQGAHDYIMKPFNTDDVLHSVATFLQAKPDPSDQKAVVTVGALRWEIGNGQILLNQTPLKLTPTEYELLTTFMKHPNTTLDAVTLVEEIRGYRPSETDARGMVRVNVYRLRQKIEVDAATPRLIVTLSGGRYMLRGD